MPEHPTGGAVIDLEHAGRPESVAAYLLESGKGPVVVDPGPSASLPRLQSALAARGYGLADLKALLLTHIHLDHAGASGTLARANRRLQVYVQERGAAHLADPTKLISSATRLYGDRMQSLWGEIAPVGSGQIVALRGGERIDLGDRSLEVAYTPGHAWHHLSYFEPESRLAFVGDAAGLYTPRLPVVLPPTPPPEFDLEAWLASIERILAWGPARLALTHFGMRAGPAEHLAALRDGLRDWAGYAKEAVEAPGPEEARIRQFGDRLRGWIAGRIAASHAEPALAAAGIEACWQGLARYWRQRETGTT